MHFSALRQLLYLCFVFSSSSQMLPFDTFLFVCCVAVECDVLW